MQIIKVDMGRDLFILIVGAILTAKLIELGVGAVISYFF